MTNIDGLLLCFTAISSTRMLLPAKRRWLSVVEKANCLLWPVVPEFAAAAGVPIVKDAELVATNGHAMTGNGLFVANIAMCVAAFLFATRPAASSPQSCTAAPDGFRREHIGELVKHVKADFRRKAFVLQAPGGLEPPRVVKVNAFITWQVRRLDGRRS